MYGNNLHSGRTPGKALYHILLLLCTCSKKAQLTSFTARVV